MRPSCSLREISHLRLLVTRVPADKIAAAAQYRAMPAEASQTRSLVLACLVMLFLAFGAGQARADFGFAQDINAGEAGTNSCSAAECVYVGPLDETVTYWVLPKTLSNAAVAESPYYPYLDPYLGNFSTGWELGLAFPGTHNFVSGGIVCGIADVCDYNILTQFGAAALSYYDLLLAIQGPAAVCIVPAGATGSSCASPPPRTCAQSNPPPPQPPTVQQLAGIGNDAWKSQKEGYSSYQVVQTYPSSDGKSFVTVYENGDPTNGGQIVIAAAGFNGEDVLQNLFADSSFTTGHVSDALKSAVSNMVNVVQNNLQQYVLNSNPQSCPASITLTGFSLGGAIAQIAGNITTSPTVTFSAPGVGNLLSQFGVTGAIRPPTPDINYRILGDQESLDGLVGQPRVGETITVMPANLQTFFAKYGNTPLSTLFVTNFNAFNLIFQLHQNLNFLEGALMNAPSMPGDISGSWPSFFGTVTASSTDLGIQYDISALTSLLTPLNVIGSQGATIQQFGSAITNLLNGFDPPAGYAYSFVADPGSPAFASIELPLDGPLGFGDVFGWTLTYYTDSGRSGTLTSATGNFTVVPGLHRISFYPIDASGNPILYDAGEFLIASTFASGGTFNGTLTTYSTPVASLPLSSGQSCNGIFNGIFAGDVSVAAGQNCTFTDLCEIKGNVTINGGSFNLTCAVDGSVTENGGSLVLGPAASVGGYVQISETSTLALGPGAAIGGNLQIQNLSAGLPQGTVCGTQVNGNLQVQINASPIEIGGTQQGCPGNTVGGNLLVDANTAAVSIDYNTVAGALHVDNDSATTDVSGNSVGKDLECQNNNTVTHIASNMVKGNNQGQCAAFP